MFAEYYFYYFFGEIIFRRVILLVTFHDITGKSLINKVNIENNSFQIDLSNYSKGLYFLKVYSNSGSVTKKLILN
ncbi:MAG: T9SS type A sorting domain-containing protein [Polaribacter sp.]|nr:T9SS type A sorting domain-containing protein [Polaribacter sp.]